jgi:hypothetical protein
MPVLFDPRRDPSERVREDDWHTSPASRFAELDSRDTVETRSRWHTELLELGRLW